MEWDGVRNGAQQGCCGPRGAIPVSPLSKECLASSSSAA